MKVQKSRIKNLDVNKTNYTGEYQLFFYRFDKTLPEYEIGDRICQMKVGLTTIIDFEVVDELQSTQRGAGGFGSTGN